ncbi:uncharacterized protein LOC129295912 [Prosopis cineraria]|uniref:uncharacterized protein LOC129295912 n=1 Tax=Prosopis cineraria TaxID=364024 RepID=UPI002410000B|nr:uncharacterized protein LOC129295912 [Prosopis cineraria]
MLHRHASNKDLKLLTAAYQCITIPHNNIYKQRTPLGNTVLHLAAAEGDNEMIASVIAVRAPHLFTVTNNNYDTALHVAARAGRASTIQTLLNCFFRFIRGKTERRGDRFMLDKLLMVSLTLFRNKQGNTFVHEVFMANGQHGDEIFQAFQHSFMQDLYSNQQHPFTEDTSTRLTSGDC